MSIFLDIVRVEQGPKFQQALRKLIANLAIAASRGSTATVVEAHIKQYQGELINLRVDSRMNSTSPPIIMRRDDANTL